MSIEDIGGAIRATRAYLASHPEDACGPDKPATAIVEGGLRCRVEGPLGTVVSDMPAPAGGAGSAPTPGWLMRAAHAACDATVIAMRAAEQGVELTRLEVTVESDSDDRGVFGAGEGVPAGPLETRVSIVIGADAASPEQLREIVAYALAHSPVGSAMSRANRVTESVTII